MELDAKAAPARTSSPAALVLILFGILTLGFAVVWAAAVAIHFVWRALNDARNAQNVGRATFVMQVPPESAPPADPTPVAGTATRIAPVTLQGPGGYSVRLPMEDGPVIVHVWLQACADCMPAFEAVRELAARDVQFPCPVVNVAYGQATPEWAAQYGVEKSLVFDPGTALVHPLGIGTFTTVVIDAEGFVRAQEIPTQPGYLERVCAAAEAAGAGDVTVPAEREEK